MAIEIHRVIFKKKQLSDIPRRPLSPFGFAIKTKQYHRYDIEKWLRFYEGVCAEFWK